ncbi:nickel-dependent hydrogenase large subunit [Desulfovibrio sp.]|uniref:nickel-dependent hydrogenase large subunit n=1 Tax=Desulfovibrio sp. TaxID=885 RepID=UPI0023BBE3D5|nr:nickel-dependent hydrogenase large subunit [Desulfovibrio sp.]MDE7242228.1 nickel-dependent hydrogenase large subunit [Desulfovibrio sp.]
MSQVIKAPQSTYTGQVVVDPLTRIEGHLRIEAEVENGKIKEARCVGTLFRGLEIILKGRNPFDAPHFTQRTCGVCTYSHSLASTRAVEDAINKPIPANATYLRNLVLSMLYLHDHLVHFYALHALDFVDVVNALQGDPVKAAQIANSISNRKVTPDDYRAVQAKLKAFVDSGQLGPFTNAYFLGNHPAYHLSPELNLIGTADYLAALRVQVKAARAMAVFGAKNPHTQFTVPGGVTNYGALTAERIKEFTDLYKETLAFIEDYYIPDLLAIASQYKECATYGGTRNFMAFGEFPDPGCERDLAKRWLRPGVILDRKIGKVRDMDPNKIAEGVAHSWYEGDKARHPYEGETVPYFTKMGDKDKYSWLKAPRYDGIAVETGPLAQVLVSYAQEHRTIKPMVDKVLGALQIGPEALFSTLGRTAARGIEALAVGQQVETWIKQYEHNITKDQQIVENYEPPKSARGVGFVNAPRGGLSHWIVTDDDARIANFQLVVPTTWNLSPRDAKNVPSACEEALVGTPVADPARPVEILRVVHSFDPCIACAVHVIDGETNQVHKFKVL